MEEVGRLWGRVICFDSHTSVGDSYESTKILIDTIDFSFIDDWVCFSMDGHVYDVHVREVGWDAMRLWHVKQMKKTFVLNVNDSPLYWGQLSSRSFVDKNSASKSSYGSILGGGKVSFEKGGNSNMGKSLHAIKGDASISNSRRDLLCPKNLEVHGKSNATLSETKTSPFNDNRRIEELIALHKGS